MDSESLKANLENHSISLTNDQLNQFEIYYRFLIEENEKLNLTAITDKEEVYLKHFYDSIVPMFFVQQLQKQELSICDVGAGAGFPSLPMKIINSKLNVSIVDSLNKRIKFLNELASKLNLEQVAFFHSRAEDFGNKKSVHRGEYDIVTARAVAKLNVLCELCLPLVKKDGFFIALKAANTEEELANAKYAMNRLGGKFIADHVLELPEGAGIRHVVVIQKTKQTPNTYPRKAGVPNKNPLVEPLSIGGE